MDNIAALSKKQMQFCLKNNIRGCALELLQWLLSANTNEPNLKHGFNKWVSQFREKGKYHRDTVKIAWKKLVNVGVVEILKTYHTWHTFFIQIHPLWARKKSRQSDRDRDSYPPKPSAVRSGDVQQQPLLTIKQQEIVQQLKIAGIQFKDYSPLWKFSEEEIEKAVLYYLQYPNIRNIRNPAGWLLDCLKYKWYRSTFLDTSKVKNPHLIAVAWENIKLYVKDCLQADMGVSLQTFPDPPNLPHPPPEEDEYVVNFVGGQKTIRHDGFTFVVEEQPS